MNHHNCTALAPGNAVGVGCDRETRSAAQYRQMICHIRKGHLINQKPNPIYRPSPFQQRIIMTRTSCPSYDLGIRHLDRSATQAKRVPNQDLAANGNRLLRLDILGKVWKRYTIFTINFSTVEIIRPTHPESLDRPRARRGSARFQMPRVDATARSGMDALVGASETATISRQGVENAALHTDVQLFHE
ncbi:hypothetical protein K493DRAFT_389751 [Basidiobolus meristosporus CBS 931.73]|uniref:Uncharacterized protein n=1 Tax=Basidiobolus meristosporus CBS 931.73 TaxID=1314790 RepID=A0A1Y1X6I9_9FUNG|nr:hypothetical protein K493DRAFT_389751 [Basidiobolus meristosporus CBS 931.73]|eukprot:ORX80914.1 hypothetical protein K493DRAFT_389751 [Basidiobolus meristosporus CBS 931.73]